MQNNKINLHSGMKCIFCNKKNNQTKTDFDSCCEDISQNGKSCQLSKSEIQTCNDSIKYEKNKNSVKESENTMPSIIFSQIRRLPTLTPSVKRIRQRKRWKKFLKKDQKNLMLCFS